MHTVGTVAIFNTKHFAVDLTGHKNRMSWYSTCSRMDRIRVDRRRSSPTPRKQSDPCRLQKRHHRHHRYRRCLLAQVARERKSGSQKIVKPFVAGMPICPGLPLAPRPPAA